MHPGAVLGICLGMLKERGASEMICYGLWITSNAKQFSTPWLGIFQISSFLFAARYQLPLLSISMFVICVYMMQGGLVSGKRD